MEFDFRLNGKDAVERAEDLDWDAIIDPEHTRAWCYKNDFDIVKIRTAFDMSLLREKLEIVQAQYKLVNKDGYEHYKGLGLQYDDDQNPIYDSVSQIVYRNPRADAVQPYRGYAKYIKLNEIGRLFSEIFYAFKNLHLSGGRLLVSYPGFKMKPHSDWPNSVTLHVPLQTSRHCKMHIDEKCFHLPADGSSYLVNTEKSHYITNESDEPRVHLTFPISSKGMAFEEINLSPEIRARMIAAKRAMSPSEFQLHINFHHKILQLDEFTCLGCAYVGLRVITVPMLGATANDYKGCILGPYVVLCPDCFNQHFSYTEISIFQKLSEAKDFFSARPSRRPISQRLADYFMSLGWTL